MPCGSSCRMPSVRNRNCVLAKTAVPGRKIRTVPAGCRAGRGLYGRYGSRRKIPRQCTEISRMPCTGIWIAGSTGRSSGAVRGLQAALMPAKGAEPAVILRSLQQAVALKRQLTDYVQDRRKSWLFLLPCCIIEQMVYCHIKLRGSGAERQPHRTWNRRGWYVQDYKEKISGGQYLPDGY